MSVENVEFMEVVRKRIIEDGVLAVDPFAVDDVSVTDGRPEFGREACSPSLKELELAFSRTAFQEMSTALQLKKSFGIETEGAVGTVKLLLNDDMAPFEPVERNLFQIFVSGPKARTCQVMGSRVFEDLLHYSLPRAMRWLRT